MSLDDYPHVKPRLKEEIHAMSDAELLMTIEQAPLSVRAWPVPFMKALLAERQAKQAGEVLIEARRANRLSVLALVVALTTIVISLFKSA